MSTIAERVKKWLIAECGASVALRALTGSPGPAWSADDSGPSRVGVFIRCVSARRHRRWADEVRAEVYCCATGEQACWTMMSTVQDVLEAVPGFAKSWGSSPTAKGLGLKFILREEDGPPFRHESQAGSVVWVGKTAYRIRGASSFVAGIAPPGGPDTIIEGGEP